MDWKSKENKLLIQAILAIKTESEAEHFLRDLMTEKEIIEFGNRLQAAVMLVQRNPYSTIVQETGLSSTTIARVAKWLKGKGGGYRLIINRTNHHMPSLEGRGLR